MEAPRTRSATAPLPEDWTEEDWLKVDSAADALGTPSDGSPPKASEEAAAGSGARSSGDVSEAAPAEAEQKSKKEDVAAAATASGEAPSAARDTAARSEEGSGAARQEEASPAAAATAPKEETAAARGGEQVDTAAVARDSKGELPVKRPQRDSEGTAASQAEQEQKARTPKAAAKEHEAAATTPRDSEQQALLAGGEEPGERVESDRAASSSSWAGADPASEPLLLPGRQSQTPPASGAITSSHKEEAVPQQSGLGSRKRLYYLCCAGILVVSLLVWVLPKLLLTVGSGGQTPVSPSAVPAPPPRPPSPPPKERHHVIPLRYVRQEKYVNEDFFKRFTYFVEPDPTHGDVQYVDSEVALNKGFINATKDRVYIGADVTTREPTAKVGRQSVRIESEKVYNGGLFIASFDHIPTGCGTWPAFWMYGEDAEHPWPTWGEYDIIEGAHKTTRVMTTLHTSEGCDQSSVRRGEDFSETWNKGSTEEPSDNCYVNAEDEWPNEGCSQLGPVGSMGAYFNTWGGGTYAAEWDGAAGHIRTWFWPHHLEPADIADQRPRPEDWGAPYSYFSLGAENCSPEHFKNMRLVFDLTFCGDFGAATFAASFGCPKEAKEMTCEEFVAAHPEKLQEAYWSIRKLDVYQWEPVPEKTAASSDHLRGGKHKRADSS
eukprot:TRINITY_DN33944_c0_g1_i1.p1 TRINITY_DN33944_c0_g1~~TRINITY_DN33944_c0_g1_i1.p1  ORF type:complete len:662 (+),score=171.97 TRINITY_DN33944_c0_g1_i1:58-2043(+)